MQGSLQERGRRRVPRVSMVAPHVMVAAVQVIVVLTVSILVIRVVGSWPGSASGNHYFENGSHRCQDQVILCQVSHCVVCHHIIGMTLWVIGSVRPAAGTAGKVRTQSTLFHRRRRRGNAGRHTCIAAGADGYSGGGDWETVGGHNAIRAISYYH